MIGLRVDNASEADRRTYDGVKDMLKRGTFVAIEGDVLLIAPSEVELNAKIVGRNPPLTHRCYVTCVGYEDAWVVRPTPSIPPGVAALRTYLANRDHIREVANDRWIPYRIAWEPDETFDTKDACIAYAVQKELFPLVMIVWVGHEEFLDGNPKPTF